MTEETISKALALKKEISEKETLIVCLEKCLIEPKGIKLIGRKEDVIIYDPELCDEIAKKLLIEANFDLHKSRTQLKEL